MCALVLQELCKDGQKGSSFFLAHTPPLEKYQTFLEGNKIVFTLVLAALCAAGVGYLNWAPQQIISEEVFSHLYVLSPLLFEGKFAPAFPIVCPQVLGSLSVGLLPGLQQGLAHSTVSRNECPWAGFRVMNLISWC